MTMKVIVGCLVGLLVLGGGYYVLQQRGQISGNRMLTQPKSDAEDSEGPTSLRSLLATNEPQQCVFSDEMGNSGTVFISNGRMRGDFESVIDNVAQASHMIVDGDTSSMWMDNTQKGWRMSLSAAAPATTDALKQQGTVDLDKPVNFSCESWSEDASLFELPSTVTFTDIGALIAPFDGRGETEGTTQPAACAACESAPAESQAQCRAALGCN